MNPCYDGSHACAMTARCRPGAGVDYSCECAPGYQGDGRSCAGEVFLGASSIVFVRQVSVVSVISIDQ